MFFVILSILDILAGKAFSYVSSHARGGNTGRVNYICNDTNEDFLVMGSSRALHHYNPKIISDSLGLSCYNCGQGGQGIILNYGILQMIEERYKPKVIIYEVTHIFDLYSNDNHKFLGTLKRFYERERIPEIFYNVDGNERWKMVSSLYRYNSIFLSLLTDYVSPVNNVYERGYWPIKHEIDSIKIGKPDKRGPYDFDSVKIKYLEDFIKLSEGSKLFLIVSPDYHGKDSLSFKPAKNLALKYNIPFWDLSRDPKYLHNALYFSDGAHLNSRGADEYTRDVVKKIKPFL